MGSTQLVLRIRHLSQPEITELSVSICEDKYIFCFEIAIEHLLTVEILQPQYDTGSDKLDTSFSQGFEGLLARMR